MVKNLRIKFRQKLRSYLLGLIAKDIDEISRDAYEQGFYNAKQESVEIQKLQTAHLMRENECLRNMMAQYQNLAPNIVPRPVTKNEASAKGE